MSPPSILEIWVFLSEYSLIHAYFVVEFSIVWIFFARIFFNQVAFRIVADVLYKLALFCKTLHTTDLRGIDQRPNADPVPEILLSQHVHEPLHGDTPADIPEES